MLGCYATLYLFAAQSVFSPNNQYQGIVDYGPGVDLTAVSFTLTNAAGDTLYRMADPEPITYYVTDDATVFAASETKLYFIRPNGQDTLLQVLNYPNGFGFSPDHGLFFASDRGGIAVYCTGGQRQLTLKPARLFASSDRGARIATVSNDTLVIYQDGAEKYIIALATPFIHELSFSPDGKTIILKEPDGREVFDADSGKKLEEP